MAVVVRGLCEGEFDAVFLRVDPDRVFVVEAHEALSRDDVTMPGTIRRVVDRGDRLLSSDMSGHKITVREVNLDERAGEAIVPLLGACVPMSFCPEPVRAALSQ
jgi:hypothetical protein